MIYYFFFFKQKTAYEVRISDWSSDVCSSDLPHRYEIGIGQIIEKRHVNERRNEQYEDHSGERYSQATRAEQPFRSLRHGISEQGKPEIQSEQATDKGQRHDIFQPVFDQEDGDEECRQNRVEKAANRQAFGGI